MFTRSVSCALVLAGSTLLAQSFTPVRELKNLSPAAIEKLHTLETLNSLPAADWRFHAGDIAHGESLTLDDSTWPTVIAPSKAPKDAVWYRRTIEVPKTLHGYDITGARVWFQFRADANGPMPEIIYFNGRRVALGDDLEPIILFEPAHPGDKILVAVKLLHTVDEKSFRGVTLRIEPSTNSGAPHLDSEMWVRPNPDDIRIQCITAANLLPALPTPRPDLLPKVEAAIAAIDTQALAAADQAAFDQSLRNAQAILSTLHSTLAQASIVEAGNSHIDAAWLWPRSETIDVVRRTFTTALQLMNEYPDYTFTQSAAQYSAWMADKYPELNDQIRQRIKEGRWEIVGGMWVEPDLNIPDGESLVRQLLIGQRYFQQEYGVTARIGWNPDSFGYNWQLPQIYKRSGLDYFVTQKMHWNDTNQLPFRLFWWQSPDGSKVLTYFPTDYVHDNVNPTRISADFAESAQRNPGTTEMLDLYGIGDHGGGPTRDMLDQANHWIALSNPQNSVTSNSQDSLISNSQNSVILSEGRSPESKDLHDSSHPQAPSTLSSTELAAVPTLRYGTAQHYFSDVEKNLSPDSPTWNYVSLANGYTPPPTAPGKVGLPTWNDELYFEYHRGVFTTQAAHKAANRASETATLDAEKLASFAWLYGEPYPAADLTENWKKITFNQFHDLAAGSGIAVIYRDAHDDYKQVFQSDREISEGALKRLEPAVDTSRATAPNLPAMLVMNSAPWKRYGTVELELNSNQSFHDNGTGWDLLSDGSGNVVLGQILSRNMTTNTVTWLFGVDAPSLGYTTVGKPEIQRPKGMPPNEMFHERESSDGVASQETASTYELVNTHIRLVLDKKNGCIISIKTLIAGKILPFPTDGPEYLAPNSCGNQLQAFKDTPKQYDAWNIDPGTLDVPPTILSKVDSISVLTDGPLRKTIRIQRTWQSSHFIQDISLDAGADIVRIENTIDWHEKHILLKAAFPLAHTSDQATYEIPYGSIERPTTRNNSFEKAKFEVPALRWADLGDATAGLSILNDSKYGYDAVGNTLRITLLRSPTWPDPDADQGTQHFTYELYPHAGPWQQAATVHRAYELNTPLTAQQVFAHTGSLPPTHSFASVDNPNVTLTAIKKAEDSDALVFRMYEWAGTATDVKLHVPPNATYAVESNLMEKPEGPHLALAPNSESDTVTVPIHPYEILTVMVFYPTKTASSN
ncbi:MAG: glycoside hydrolase family 38 C-terminal domain-containing protein [Acidobacteriaceae bacterium]|jgi:alpha-mannosidase